MFSSFNSITIGCRGCGAVHAFADDRLARRPRTPDTCVVRPLPKNYACKMGHHDAYGKAVLKAAAGSAFQNWGPAVKISYGTAGGATIDGVVGNTIAVEVESRVSKQVRGAVLDLLCHPYPKKLLVLLPVHMSNAKLCSDQCRNILSRFVSSDDYRVLVLTGSGDSNASQSDLQLVRMALEELGFLAEAT